MIENGRTLNCSKVKVQNNYPKVHQYPLRSNGKFNDSLLSNGSCGLSLEHVELHFNITNVFEDNSENNADVAQQDLDYDEMIESTNGTDPDSLAMKRQNGSEKSAVVHSKSGSADKKPNEKGVNSPVYVIFTWLKEF